MFRSLLSPSAIMASLLLAWFGLAPGVGKAEPVAQILSQAQADYEDRAAQIAAITTPQDMRLRAGHAAAPGPHSGQPTAEFDLIDLRFVLIEMARTSGSNEQLSVLRAQPDGRLKALSVRKGAADLAAVISAAEEMGFYGADGLTIPLIIQANAHLTIAGPLLLDRANGAFVINFGRTQIIGGSITGTGGENPNISEFRPFFTTLGTGSFDIRDAVIQSLGYGSAPAFSGFAAIEAGLYRPQAQSSIQNTLLRDVMSTQFDGLRAPSISGSVFDQSGGNALELRQTQNAQIADNLFINSGGDALRITHGATGTQISGVDIYQARLNGIRINISSHATQLDDVTIWKAGKIGLAVDRSDCIAIRRLSVLHPGQKGVSLQRTRASVLTDSRVLGSRNVGVFVADQPFGTVLTLARNRIAANRVGISTAAPAEIRMDANDFTEQFPRFLKGDLSGSTATLTADLTGSNPLILQAGGTDPALASPMTCTRTEES
ncbi:right-handed parallel beta-helix repeat-containing protein [Loktanella salsilacus]|uniref:right-handed parallel beta-helix repeat-containing protein n=1 Tax=Loktanella salsilacus TaxID=195913 RepID=UPI003734C274